MQRLGRQHVVPAPLIDAEPGHSGRGNREVSAFEVMARHGAIPEEIAEQICAL